MRILGFDIGSKRIGVAVSDPSGAIATPVTVIDTGAALKNRREIGRLIEDHEPELLVVGLPISLDGTAGPQAGEIRNLTDALLVHTGVPIRFVDERFSSAEAKRRMREAGLSERDARGRIDMVAASIFLQAYLDSVRASGGERD